MKKIIFILISVFIIFFWFFIFQNYQKEQKIKNILKNIEKEDFMFFTISAFPKDEKILESKENLKFIYKEALKNNEILIILEEKKEKNPWIRFLIDLIKQKILENEKTVGKN